MKTTPTIILCGGALVATALLTAAEPDVPPGNAPVTPEPTQNLAINLGGGATMEFVLIRPGSFTMGSDKYVDSKPSHQVTITAPFYLGKYEVTQEQWETIMGSNPSQFKGAKHPVERVSWLDCHYFLAKLQEKAPGWTFRLPTEAEWEYACRAGSIGDPCAGGGKGPLPGCAGVIGDANQTSHPVGSSKPNAWGLHDMHGNVWEWCADRYGDYPAAAAVDPHGPESGSTRVCRGGNWPYIAYYCHAAGRNHREQDSCDKLIGFRVTFQAGSQGIRNDSRYIGSSTDWLRLQQDRGGDMQTYTIERDKPSGVTRDGKILLLQARNGTKVRLIDNNTDDSDATFFSYYETVPALDAHVVHVQYWEGDSWLLVSRETGVRTQLSELPVVSPDKRWFATASYDFAYNPNELVIWSAGKDGSFKRELQVQPGRWGPTFLQWLSPTRLRVRCESPQPDWSKPDPKPVARTFHLDHGKWRQTGDPEPWAD